MDHVAVNAVSNFHPEKMDKAGTKRKTYEGTLNENVRARDFFSHFDLVDLFHELFSRDASEAVRREWAENAAQADHVLQVIREGTLQRIIAADRVDEMLESPPAGLITWVNQVSPILKRGAPRRGMAALANVAMYARPFSAAVFTEAQMAFAGTKWLFTDWLPVASQDPDEMYEFTVCQWQFFQMVPAQPVAMRIFSRACATGDTAVVRDCMNIFFDVSPGGAATPELVMWILSETEKRILELNSGVLRSKVGFIVQQMAIDWSIGLAAVPGADPLQIFGHPFMQVRAANITSPDMVSRYDKLTAARAREPQPLRSEADAVRVLRQEYHLCPTKRDCTPPQYIEEVRAKFEKWPHAQRYIDICEKLPDKPAPIEATLMQYLRELPADGDDPARPVDVAHYFAFRGAPKIVRAPK